MFNLYTAPAILSVLIALALAALSIIKGKFKLQNLLFSMVVLWWTLIPAAFIFHSIYKGDSETILKIEKILHFFYVYVPVINLLFFHRLLNVKRTAIIISTVLLSTVLCIQIFTGNYFNGLHTYSWGSIAAGGTVSPFIGIYGLLFISYLIAVLISKLRREHNRIKQLKLKYILVSIIVIALMQILNLPAMYGVDCYPVGNFIFIPLGIMAYGILQNRLLEIRTVLHISLMWVIVTALALSFNLAIYLFIENNLNRISRPGSLLLFLFWFILNYHYIKIIQPKIDRLFNKHKFDLKKQELNVTKNILQLRTVDELTTVYRDSIQKTLYFKSAQFLFVDTVDSTIPQCTIRWKEQNEITDYFLTTELILKDRIETDPELNFIREPLHRLFCLLNCDHIIPLVQNSRVTALLALNERMNLKLLSNAEKKFIRNITAALLISLANSTVYQDLKNLKDNLEERVNSRTKELRITLQQMEAAHLEIKSTKDQLQNERDGLKIRNRIMEEELLLAKKIQEQLIPAETPSGNIHAIYKPMDKVGGDFFDFMKFRNPDKTGIFVSDVSGHGVPAAFITSMIKTMILQAGTDREDPAALLAYLNKNLRNYTGGNFITAIYCIYDKSTGTATYANAGHNDPYMVSYNLISTLSGDKGLPLAVKSNPELSEQGREYTNNQAAIPPNSRLVFFTDGLTECSNMKNPAEMFEEQLQKSVLCSTRECDAKSFAESIYAELVRFRGSESFEDDICIICMNT